MYEKIKGFFNRKAIKYIILASSIIGFVLCLIIMRPQIIDSIIKVIEAKVLHRSLVDMNKWKDYLFGYGFSFTIYFVIIWYLFIKNYFIVSLCFLITAFSIYFYTYKLLAINHASYQLRFPLIVLACVIVYHFFVKRRRFSVFFTGLKKLYYRLIESKFLNSSFFIFISGGLLGALFFIHIYGTVILNFSYTDWLMSGGDLSQHYLGWRLFRNSAWHFPLGLIDNIIYPFKISIIYTDSIPLFSIIFKLLSPILPGNFQFFGFFGIICYVLQGGIGALIVKKIGGNTCQSIICSLFFTLSTVMIWRLYTHTSLAAHFIILLCILACLKSKTFSLKKQIVLWGCLLSLSVSIHLYFVPMVMVFMFFSLLQEYILMKNFKKQFIIFGVSLLILAGTMYSLGAFYFVKGVGSGLGDAAANINSFINPMGMSSFIKDMPLISGAPHEGFSYLGLGLILFLILIIGHTLFRRNETSLNIAEKSRWFPYICGVILFFLIFSLSPTIAFNQYRLFAYPIIFPIEYFWGIFRSTGRYTWPIIYIFMCICFWWTIKRLSVKKSFIVLCALLLIQWVDIKPWFINKGNQYKTEVVWQTELPSPAWVNLANDYKHIFFMNDYIKLNSFLDLAGDHGMTVNDAYLARSNFNMIIESKQNEAEYLYYNGPKNDTIYLFENIEQASLLAESGIHFFNIDGVIIGIHSQKPYLENYALF